MLGINKVILIGTVGKEPEIKTFQSGKTAANISVATGKSVINRDTKEKTTETEWHNVSAYGNLAEIISKWVHKGSRLFIEGEIHTRKYTDRNNVTKYITEIVMNNMQMLNKIETNEQQNNPNSQWNSAAPAENLQQQTAAQPYDASIYQGYSPFGQGSDGFPY